MRPLPSPPRLGISRFVDRWDVLYVVSCVRLIQPTELHSPTASERQDAARSYRNGRPHKRSAAAPAALKWRQRLRANHIQQL
ncbi:hypothetical protein SRHO_G00163570 [Serrasalmus rhombeus]